MMLSSSAAPFAARPSRRRFGTGCFFPPPSFDSMRSVSAASRASWSVMSAIRLRSGCGSIPCSRL